MHCISFALISRLPAHLLYIHVFFTSTNQYMTNTILLHRQQQQQQQQHHPSSLTPMILTPYTLYT